MQTNDLCTNKTFLLTGLINWTKPLSIACLYSLSHFGQIAQDNQTLGWSLIDVILVGDDFFPVTAQFEEVLSYLLIHTFTSYTAKFALQYS